MKRISVFVVLAALAFTACGGGGGGGGGGLNGASAVSGTCYSENGDPMANVTIAIPTGAAAMTIGKAKRTQYMAVSGNGTTCDDPSQTSCASTCTGADGTFNLSTTGCTGSEADLLMERGNLRKTVGLNCPAGGGTCTLTSTESTFGGGGGTTTWPKVAVVTGSWDRMQDVLGKLAPTAYGTVDSNGILAPGSENTTNLTFIDGNGSLSDTYKDWNTYLDGTNSLSGFDIVFINCGNDYDYLLSDAAVRTVLQNYVSAGGILYVTDLSYDFVNQPFPQVMNFPGDVNATTPGGIGVAELGTAGIWLNAAVNDTGMAAWLRNVAVIQHDADTPGNPEVDCSGTYTTRTGALLADGTIPIDDFLSGWAQMIAAWDTNTTIWISSGAGVDFDGLANRPLTVSRYGSADSALGTGRIFYSSYHTADSCPTPYFWPQERVLQYLIFEAF